MGPSLSLVRVKMDGYSRAWLSDVGAAGLVSPLLFSDLGSRPVCKSGEGEGEGSSMVERKWANCREGWHGAGGHAVGTVCPRLVEALNSGAQSGL